MAPAAGSTGQVRAKQQDGAEPEDERRNALQHIGHGDDLPDTRDTHLYHLVRTRDDLTFGEQLRGRLVVRYHAVVRDERERFSVAEIDPRLLAHDTFWICGSPHLTEQLHRNLRRASVGRGRPRVEYFR